MKFKFFVATGMNGSKEWDEVDIPDEDLEDKDEQGREEVLSEYLNEWVWDHIDAWYEEVE